MENKYYLEIKKIILKLIENGKNNDVLKIINEELSMPYIPSEFEKFLLLKLDELPTINFESNHIFSLEKIIDLLIKLDKSKNDFEDLINQLKKYNLKNEKDELEYYFENSTNKRNRVTIFELLIKEKVDIECEYGNPLMSQPITESVNYLSDKDDISNILIHYPTLIDPAIKILNEIYLTSHLGQKINGGYAEMVVFTISKIFKQDDIGELITDMKDLKNKLESFKSFDNI